MHMSLEERIDLNIRASLNLSNHAVGYDSAAL
jgi:hypothetical protein